MRRIARHDTIQAQAGVRSEEYWDFQPRQRVMTTDGYPGRVEAVYDGPHPGNEAYEVRLDGGLGGGMYTAAQLSVLAEDSRTAASDYPELEDVLTQRPDPAKQVVMAHKETAPSPGPSGRDYSSRRGWAPRYPGVQTTATTQNGVQIDGHGDAPDEVRAADPNDYDERSTEGDPDPKMTKPLTKKDETGAHGGELAKAPAGVHLEGAMSPAAIEHVREREEARQQVVDRHVNTKQRNLDRTDVDDVREHDDPAYARYLQSLTHLTVPVEWIHTSHLEHFEAPEHDADLFDHLTNAHGYAPHEAMDLAEPHGLQHVHEQNHGSMAHFVEEDLAIPHHHPTTWYEKPEGRVYPAEVSGQTGGRQSLDPGHSVSENAPLGDERMERWRQHMVSLNMLRQPRDDLDESARARGHDMEWKGRNLNTKEYAAAYHGECKNCGHTAVAYDMGSSSHGHVTTDARKTICEGPGTKWKTDMVNDLMHKRFTDAVAEFGQNIKNEKDKQWLRDQGIEASLNPYAFIAQASTDSDLRFQLTAAWADVRAKAKRIRSEGKVRITHATEGMVIGEVRGDHSTYESGLQRLPGQRQSVATWSCGCKWGAYHWGAADDFSRYAGRMCSHAYALQLEAMSRGMFGKTVEIDTSRPDWTPPRVVVKYDLDTGRNNLARSSAKAGPGEWEMLPVNIFAFYALHDGESGSDIRLLLGAAGLLPREGAVNNPWGERVVEVPPKPYGATQPANKFENPASAGFLATPDPDGWGSLDPTGMMVMGPSHMASRDEAVFEPVLAMSDEDFQNAGEPIRQQLGIDGTAGDAQDVPHPAVPDTNGTCLACGLRHTANTQGFYEDEDSPADPNGLEATLHPAPEPALPETDGEREDLGHPESFTPEDPSIQTMGTQMAGSDELLDETLQPSGDTEDIVRAFQASAGAKALVSAQQTAPGTAPAPGVPSDGDIAAHARQVLALKAFSPAEQQSLINEAPGKQASNTDKLEIEGTHYANLDEEDEASWLS